MPDGKIVESYFVVELPPSACALAITESGEVILTRQYRLPIDETILELPGGFIDKGENPKTAIERELLEETGYSFASIVEDESNGDSAIELLKLEIDRMVKLAISPKDGRDSWLDHVVENAQLRPSFMGI